MIDVIGTQRAGADRAVAMAEIRANTVLPADRTPITLTTTDGQSLVGELARPLHCAAVATLVCVHPLPTHGGMMDSHLLRKMAWRLPALAGYAVLRFNTRGTGSRDGQSTGHFDFGEGEGRDLASALSYVQEAALPKPWLIGWSFGTDVILKHLGVGEFAGAILLSPPLHFSDEADLDAWAATDYPLTVLVPELDDYLRPPAARVKFARIAQSRIVIGDAAKHLWVGETSVRFVLNEIVRVVTPQYFADHPDGLPNDWDGPMERWSDL